MAKLRRFVLHCAAACAGALLLAATPVHAQGSLDLAPVGIFVEQYIGVAPQFDDLAETDSDPDLPPLSVFLQDAIGKSPVHRVAARHERASQGSHGANEQRMVADFIANRYRVSADFVAPVVMTAYQAAARSSLDPLLVLAVIAIESSFNPTAVSITGARGLMQVMPKYHMDKIALHGDESILFTPRMNIRVGVQILQEYLRRAGEIESALQMYVGAIDDANSSYARKVMTERSLLDRMVAGLRRDI